jgi:hypothetical protein
MKTTTAGTHNDSAGEATTSRTGGEPLKLRKRIGSTAYTLSIRFCETATETAGEKTLRLIEREVAQSA